MTGAQIQAEVALSLGNMPTNDPWYPYLLGDSTHPSIATQALNKLVVTGIGGNNYLAGLFPELEDIAIDVSSTAGNNVIAYPSNAIVVYDLTSAQSASVPDWNLDREHPVVWTNPLEFGYLTKSATVTGYARLWTRIGVSLKLWPTPSASYLDTFRRYYLKEEPTLTSGTSPLINARWHDLAVKMTTAMMLEKMERYEESRAMMASVTNEIQTAANITAAEMHPRAIRVAGGPTRAMVYGR